MKYFVIGICIVVFLTVGMPIWAGYSVDIAVALWRAGMVRQGFAPNLGQGLFISPVLIGVAAVIAAGRMKVISLR